MTVSLICYLLAVLFFILAAFGWRGWALPIGLALFALGHCLAGVQFKS